VNAESRIVLVRHGETEWSVTGKHTGRSDIPLTERGRREADHAGRALLGRHFSLVLSSPLSRAFDTCALAGFGDRAELDDDLLEWDYGDDEGRTTAEIRVERPGWLLWRDGVEHGETADEVGTRVDRVIARATEADEDVLVVAHGHVLRVLAARWLGRPPTDGQLFALSTAAVCELGFEHDLPVIWRWNDTSHLDD
jgi:probable phosphoglycerate mutase